MVSLDKIDGLLEFYKRHTLKETCDRFGLLYTNHTHVKLHKLWPKNGAGSIREKRVFKKSDVEITSHGCKLLKKLRKEHAMTRAEVASYLGMNVQYLAQIEQGIHGLTRDNIYYLACLFCVSPSEFFPPTIPVL